MFKTKQRLLRFRWHCKIQQNIQISFNGSIELWKICRQIHGLRGHSKWWSSSMHPSLSLRNWS